MPRVPRLVPHAVRRAHLPALAALVVAILVAACGAAQPSPAGSAVAAGTASPSPPSSAAAPSAAPLTSTPAPAAPISVATAPAAANQPTAIHLLEDPIDFTDVKVGSLTGCTSTGGCLGDQLVGHSRMLDAATHKEIGAFLVNCVLIDPGQSLYSCPANTITLTGRGQIVFTESLLFTSDASRQALDAWRPWPIIGGTGEFLGATGTVEDVIGSTWSYLDCVITITN